MRLFLLLHVPQHVALRAAAEHRQLALVDAFGAVFAGVVDADDAFHRLARGEVAGQASGGCFAHAALRLLRRRNMAMADEKARLISRFSPAVEIGRSGRM